MKQLNLYLFTFFYASTFSLAQTHVVDSLQTILPTIHDTTRIHTLVQLGRKLARTDTIQSLAYLQEALKISQKLGFTLGEWKTNQALAYLAEKEGKNKVALQFYQKNATLARGNNLWREEAQSWLDQGHVLKEMAQYDEARQAFTQALRKYQVHTDDANIADCFTNIGNVYENQGFYVRALQYYLQALRLFEKLHQDETIGQLYNNIAIIHKKQGDFALALAYHQRSIQTSEQIKDDYGIGVSLINMGIIYKDQKNYTKATQVYERALAIFEKIDEPYGVAACLHNLGVLQNAQSKYSEAIAILNRSQQVANQLDLTNIKAKNDIALGEAYHKSGKHALARQHLQTALELACRIQSWEDIRDASKNLSDLYSSFKKPQAALTYYQLYTAAKDTLLNQEKSHQLTEMRLQYDTEAKEKQIELLKHQREMQSAKSKINQYWSRGLLLGVILLSSLCGFIWISYRNKVRANQTLKYRNAEILKQKEEIQVQQEKLLEANKALQSLNEEKNALIAIVAHDLRAPLNRVKGLLSLLKMDTGSFSAEQLDYIDKANSSTDYLRDMINRILDLEAIESKRVLLRMETIDLVAVVQTVYSHFHPEAARKKITLIPQWPMEGMMIRADKNYLLQVFENLVSNALKFSPPRNNVYLNVYSENGQAYVEVQDEGPGISEEDKKRLFGRFQRLSAQPTSGEASTGLGLSIVKKYLDAMEGEVVCKSTLGEGTTFVVSFQEADVQTLAVYPNLQ
jgi:signal transduction histidine kinase